MLFATAAQLTSGEVVFTLGRTVTAPTVPIMIMVAALGWMCTALSVVALVPQLWRSVRYGVGGVCADTLALTALSGLWWTWYSIAIGNGPSFVASALGVAVPALTLGVVLRKTRLSRRTVTLLLVGLALLIPVAYWSPNAVAGLATTAGLVRAMPQAWHALTAADLSGVSLSAWSLTLLNAIAWPAYGFLVDTPLLGASSIATLPCAAIICWRVLRLRAAAPAPMSPAFVEV
jgi:uncharacterized protein with PQ loop repeat